MAKNEAGGVAVTFIPPAWESPDGHIPGDRAYGILRDTETVRRQKLEPGTIVRIWSASYSGVCRVSGPASHLDWRVDLDWCEPQACYGNLARQTQLNREAADRRAADKLLAQLEPCQKCGNYHIRRQTHLILWHGSVHAVCDDCYQESERSRAGHPDGLDKWGRRDPGTVYGGDANEGTVAA